MFTLKNYQKETLAVLRRYLEAARLDGPQAAFEAVIAANPAARRQAYWAIPELEDAPYVCLRLPTGGGKTLLAAHSAAIAAQAFLERDYPLVLWLVPTNTIRLQTLETLKKPGHPNRLALEDAFGGRLQVVDITDFALIRPQDLRSKAVVVVGT